MLPKHRSINRLILIRGFYLNLSSMPINGNIHAVPFHVAFTFRAKGGVLNKVYTGSSTQPRDPALNTVFHEKDTPFVAPSANPWYQLFVSNNSNLVKVTYLVK